MSLDYTIQRDVVLQGFDGRNQWFGPRAAATPSGTAVLTMSLADVTGSDLFHAIHSLHSDDFGQTWSAPVEHADSLGRRTEANGDEVVVCDLTPAYHAATGTLLATGHTARYRGHGLAPDPRRRETAYTVYDPQARAWSPWRILETPDPDGVFFSAGAGATQRVDLDNGDILLPVYVMPRQAAADSWHACYHATVFRCGFDGATLRVLEQGNTMTCPEPRGFCEPSLTRFGGRFFLTLRNDIRGYAAVSRDGLHFDAPVPWRFDDGEELGSYNTQQHWVTHDGGLFLVYTRRGAGNDRVFRHRAPLFIAEVDAESLRVRRATERVIAPDAGAQLGNFGAVDARPDESWVLTSEVMQGDAREPFNIGLTLSRGADNRVYLCRVRWNRPRTQTG